jgi:hypothetical protein
MRRIGGSLRRGDRSVLKDRMADWVAGGGGQRHGAWIDLGGAGSL